MDTYDTYRAVVVVRDDLPPTTVTPTLAGARGRCLMALQGIYMP